MLGWGRNYFFLKNGKGLLTRKYGSSNTHGLSCLVYDNIPLSKFHADEYFPDVFTVACMEWAGDLSDSTLDKILKHKEICDSSTLYYIVKSLFALKNSRFKQMAFFIGKNEAYGSIWNDVYSLIAKIKDEEVENFFVEFLINDEKLRPDITKIVDDYFKAET